MKEPDPEGGPGPAEKGPEEAQERGQEGGHLTEIESEQKPDLGPDPAEEAREVMLQESQQEASEVATGGEGDVGNSLDADDDPWLKPSKQEKKRRRQQAKARAKAQQQEEEAIAYKEAAERREEEYQQVFRRVAEVLSHSLTEEMDEASQRWVRAVQDMVRRGDQGPGAG